MGWEELQCPVLGIGKPEALGRAGLSRVFPGLHWHVGWWLLYGDMESDSYIAASPHIRLWDLFRSYCKRLGHGRPSLDLKTLPFFSVCLFLPLCLVVLRPLVPRSSHLFTSLSQAPNIHWTGFFCFCFFKNFNSYCRFRGYKCRFVTWVYVWYWGLGYDWNCHLGSERDAQ